MKVENNLDTDKVRGLVWRLAFPSMLAQFVNVMYSIVDRMYIGNIPEVGALALAGVGICGPVVTLISSFASWIGVGGAPLMSIRLGQKNERAATQMVANCFALLTGMALIIMTVSYLFKDQLLVFFGAGPAIFPYANQYMSWYLTGTAFALISAGMNQFIICQGFATVGMKSVVLGAVSNIILDPIFIFVFHMGVRGAALATILSQFLSAAWIIAFLTGKKTILRLRPSAMKLEGARVLRIVGLGMSGFTMSITNSLVQIMYNSMLQKFGGDLYVGIMTVINSVREVISMPVNGLTNSAQPVLGFNYGAREYKRVQKAIVFMSVVCILYTVVAWGFVDWFPEFFIRIFNREGDMVEAGIPAIRMYFFGFFMMSLQFAGQSVFVGLGKSRNAVFFSIFRKVIIVIPLIIILPTVFGLGTQGILMAEPISNFIGGAACFGTMLLTVWPELKRGGEKNQR